MTQSKVTVVVGAGVLGLTSAVALQSALDPEVHQIVILAEHFPGSRSVEYASPWAGAHFRHIPSNTPQRVLEHTMTLHTYNSMKKIAEMHPEAGIKFMDGYEYMEEARDESVYTTGGFNDLEDVEVFSEGHPDLPAGTKWGYKYKSWCLNAPVYCAWLLRRFLLRGGKMKETKLQTIDEAFALGNVYGNVQNVINCSGMGFGDRESFINRGQTCVVSNPCLRTITYHHSDGSMSYIIPRPLEGGTIIGGVRQPHNWDPNPSMETREKFFASAAKMYSRILNTKGKFDVMSDIVGRRPDRNGGMRLEAESLAENKRVIHAYGAGGRGYEMSWGVAKNVVHMALEV